jgi:hypothetical protein
MAPNSNKKFFERRLHAPTGGALEEVMTKLEEALYNASPHLPSLGLTALFPAADSTASTCVVRRLDLDEARGVDGANSRSRQVHDPPEHAAVACQRLPAGTKRDIHGRWLWLTAERSGSPCSPRRASNSPRIASPRNRLRTWSPVFARPEAESVGDGRDTCMGFPHSPQIK